METRDRTDDRGRTSLVGAVLVAGVVVAVVVTATLAVRTLDTADASATASTTPPSTTVSTTTSTTIATTTSAPTTTTTTTVPVTTTTTAPPRPPSLNRGSEGAEVEALQHRLAALGFYVPVIDGRYGALTQQAVMAFQMSAGIGRDGVAGPTTRGALETAEPVRAREGGDHIEVDLERQIMILVRGEATYVFNTSSGRSGWRTPPGRFTITREIDGVRHAPLGDLYRPKYFNGGIALHGSPSIPGHPASHGCTRLHDAVVDHIWSADLAPVGTPVWVY